MLDSAFGNVDHKIDRGVFPRGRGLPTNPTRGLSPIKKSQTSLKRTIARGKFEPLFLRGEVYNNPKRMGKVLKRINANPSRTGIEFPLPITMTHLKYLYQISSMLNQFRALTERIRPVKEEISSARKLFFLIKRFSETFYSTRGSVVDSSLRVCAIRLRVAETERRSAGMQS